jgi:hypothetical protein
MSLERSVADSLPVMEAGNGMRRRIEAVGLAVASVMSLALSPASAVAQVQFHLASTTGPGSSPPPTDIAGWRFTITPYAWLTGLSGRVGVRSVATNVDLDAVDVLSMLRFGAMGTAEARHGSWIIAADGIYASLGHGTVIAFRGDTGTFAYTQKEAIVQPTFGYTIGGAVFAIDWLLGARYWYLGAGLDVDRTLRPATISRSDSREWVDATGGARLRWRPDPTIQIVAGADAGGGGAQSTWQAYGSIEADVWHKVTIGLGYRVLSVDYDRRNFLFDTRTSGITLGAKFHL